MVWLVQSPYPILVIGVALEIVLLVILLATSRGDVLYAMAAVAVLTLIGLLIERAVVTDEKLIGRTLENARAAVAANDLPGVLAQIASTAEEERQAVQATMKRTTFTAAKLSNLKITVYRETNPPSAKVELFAIAELQDRRGEYPYNSYRGDVVVTLEQIDGRWLITKAEEGGRPGEILTR